MGNIVGMSQWSSDFVNIEEQYLALVEKIMRKGVEMPNRTKTPTKKIACAMIQHNLELGFPLLTTKRVPFRLVATELEGFVKGITDKRWFQERGCHIWDEWCNPQKIPYGTDLNSKTRMMSEPDLGFIYGYQWRNFNSSGYDQFKNIIETLKKDKTDRRLVVSAWNPLQLGQMALPPCHVLFHIVVIGNKLNLCWFQRSCDMMLGVPFNIASYALLTHLIAKETGLIPSTVTGFLSDVHIYTNHYDGVATQLCRKPKTLPTLAFNKWSSIFEWSAVDCEIQNYCPEDKIDFPIAI